VITNGSARPVLSIGASLNGIGFENEFLTKKIRNFKNWIIRY